MAVTANTATAGAQAPDRRRYLILAICCMSLFIVGLDNTIVNIALPSIRRELHATVPQLQWTIDSYTLVLASLLMLSGSMADRFGRARIFKLGLVLFTLGSLLCSLAPTVQLLIVFRMMQAVGGSMLNPVAMSIIRNTFTDARERAQAIGLWAGVIGVSMAMGPVLGGALVEGGSWRSVFWVNVPVGLVAAALTWRFVPESKAPRARRVDPVGQVLVIVLLASTVYAIIEGPSHGWLSGEILGLFAVAALAVATLVHYERKRVDPLIDVRFFASVPFSGATVIAIAAFVALGGFLFLNTIYLQDGRGLSPLHAGLCTLPMAAMTVVVGPLTGRLVGARGARPSLVIGGGAILLAGLMLTALSADHLARLADRQLCRVRHRLRLGEPTDHEHRGLRHAARAGRRCLSRGLDEPPGGSVPRRSDRRGDRRGGHDRPTKPGDGHTPWVVAGGRVRPVDRGTRVGDHHALGAGHGDRHRRAAVRRRSAFARPRAQARGRFGTRRSRSRTRRPCGIIVNRLRRTLPQG